MKLRINLTQLSILTFFFSLLMVSSCQKEKSQTGSDAQQQTEASQVSSESDGESEIVFNGIFDDAIGVNDEVGIGGTGIFGRVTVCPEVTITHPNAPAVFPIRVVLDFGVNGCVGNDGHLRKGKIITVYTNRLLVPGAMATTEFDGFYFDSIKVEGRHKITNTSPVIATQPPTRQFTADVTDARLTRPSGNYIEWNSHKVITQTEGVLTNIPLDDIFKVEGNANGKVKRGALIVLWESNITEPLVKRFNCRWIVKGRIRTVRVNTSPTGTWVAILDFGAGTCDNQAVITINGIPHQITLP
jgi:hypothetical protein